LLDTAHKRIEECDTDHRGRVSLRDDLDRATAFFDGFSPKRSRGAAIFAASAADVFRPYLLPRPTAMRVLIDDSPFSSALVRAADLRDWLIVLIDSRHARLMHGNTDHIEQIERVKGSVPGRHERAGPSDHQRHVEKAVDVPLEHVAHELDAQLAIGVHERVILGGPPEILPRLESSHMSNPAREHIAGHIEIEVRTAIADDVRRAATPVFEEDELPHEHELLDRLAARLARADGAVTSLDDVRDALAQRRVETVLYDERGVPSKSALESAIAAAVVQSAAILPMRHAPEALDQHGHIASILRF
jgi:stalled ribosome rescue protein Dom34